MAFQKIVNNPLGSYPVSVDRAGAPDYEERQNVGLDIGTVSGGIWTPSKVTAANPLPITGTATITPAAITAASPTFATVGVASNLALGPGTYKQITFVITTAANVSLGFDAAAVLNSGVTMIGRGASYTLDGPITLATGVNAIASAAATNLAIQAFT